MAYEMKDKKGALFPNKEKEHEKQPDFTGKVKINGKEWRLAAWNTESRNGDPYLSIAVSDPADYKRREEGERDSTRRPGRHLSDEEFEQARGRNASYRELDFSDDDIPF